jgi:hypothetical protein
MPRPKKTPKVSVSKKFDTKTAIRTAFNALKATGKLPGPLGRPGKIAKTIEKGSRVAKARSMESHKPGPVKTMKGSEVPQHIKDMIKKTVTQSTYKKPVPHSVLRQVNKAIKQSKENRKQGSELSNKFKTSKEGQSKSLIVPKHLRGERFNWKKDL